MAFLSLFTIIAVLGLAVSSGSYRRGHPHTERSDDKTTIPWPWWHRRTTTRSYYEERTTTFSPTQNARRTTPLYRRTAGKIPWEYDNVHTGHTAAATYTFNAGWYVFIAVLVILKLACILAFVLRRRRRMYVGRIITIRQQQRIDNGITVEQQNQNQTANTNRDQISPSQRLPPAYSENNVGEMPAAEEWPAPPSYTSACNPDPSAMPDQLPSLHTNTMQRQDRSSIATIGPFGQANSTREASTIVGISHNRDNDKTQLI